MIAALYQVLSFLVLLSAALIVGGDVYGVYTQICARAGDPSNLLVRFIGGSLIAILCFFGAMIVLWRMLQGDDERH